MDSATNKRDRALSAEFGAEGRVSIAVLATQAVVDMDGADRGARLCAVCELEKEDAVSAP